ncbi:MAG: tRNA (guanosine(37)-N1)-methyltransferase TrmD [Bacteroides sp.]|nr:tRNA (guanosine(37)-N1)-methyltransferase TrmD [Eubacterium sp.]MCM1419585.1 tRNA (guanosine(37)-N1)-methyltransferase TrmD [Roseburia sp.]MCM1463538.1 tRNA (guanosine(37)-N1)-methyltransferase TrmD [Bacteroides sp.]
MRIDIATLFPAMCEAVLNESVIGRARRAGYITLACHNIRDYTLDKHRRVDDKAYGGGTGMIIQAQPVYDCIRAIEGSLGEGAHPRLIYLSPQGRTLTQEIVKELAAEENLILLCGHYEGIDQRVLDELAVEEISVGDFVVTGGEVPALLLADAVARLCPGVLPNEDAYTIESHYNGLLEHPLYTRPEVWRERAVPEVLISGHHEKIRRWQEEKAREATQKKRPDLLTKAEKNGAKGAKTSKC